MPIARLWILSPSVSGSVTPEGSAATEPLFAGQAVALVDAGGSKVVRPCGAMASDDGARFFGFVFADVALGSVGTYVTGRGSIVTPLVEGGGTLTVDVPVYLSMTRGEVTQVAPSVSGSLVVPVGYAVSPTELVLTTDVRAKNP